MLFQEESRVVIIRFGHDWDQVCMQMDEVSDEWKFHFFIPSLHSRCAMQRVILPVASVAEQPCDRPGSGFVRRPAKKLRW